MKRAHRSRHRLFWLLLAPGLIALLYLSIDTRPTAPVQDALPPALHMEGDT